MNLPTNFLLSTTYFITGYEITETLGVCRGSTVRARNVGRDIMAGLKNMVGGEIEEYTVCCPTAASRHCNAWWRMRNLSVPMPL